MRSVRAGALVLALSAGMILALQPLAIAQSATKTEIFSSQVDSGDERVDAVLTRGSNHRAIAGETLVFRYYKKVHGAWQLKGTKSAETSGLGLATAFFNALHKGRCKVTASFAGTNSLEASKDSWVIRCANGAKV